MVTEFTLYKNLLDNLQDGVFLFDKDLNTRYCNKAAESLTGYAFDEIDGKDLINQLTFSNEETGNKIYKNSQYLKEAINKGIFKCEEIFIKNKNGDFSPVLMRIIPVRDENKKIHLMAQIITDNTFKHKAFKKIKELEEIALIDPTTRVNNRRYIERSIDSKLEEYRRYNHLFGILFIDIDNFKLINDTYDHSVGDKVLEEVSLKFSSALRKCDVFGRWGGETRRNNQQHRSGQIICFSEKIKIKNRTLRH